jgi:tetratricopeptide (TPR) repeat protein
MWKYFLAGLLTLIQFAGFGQENRLALQYYRNGDYEKAASLYQQLYSQNESNDYYLERYIDCLFLMEDFDNAERVLKRELRKNPTKSKIRVLYGQLFEKQYKEDQAKVQYELALEHLIPDRGNILILANYFANNTQYDYAIRTLIKGGELLKDSRVFSYNLGDLYRRKGDTPNMISSFLNSLEVNPDRLSSLQTLFQQFLFEADYEILQAQLLKRIQKSDAIIQFNELLIWVFVQRKNYRFALVQSIALDKRLDENGGRVFEIAEIIGKAKEYKIAIEGFDYIVKNKGNQSPFYLDAKRAALKYRKEAIVHHANYTTSELKELEGAYIEFLDEFGKSYLSANIILELAELKALYLNDLGGAIEELNFLLQLPNLSPYLEAQCKLNLGDYYLMIDEIWEATLLYSQVDKSFKEEVVGQEARFKNARLSYFSGDFEWAQAQFDILKSATSRVIANDALDLSVFIIDNLGLDTSALALQMYADAELLVFRNLYEESLAQLDSILLIFPNHQLEDDVLFLKGKIAFLQRRYDEVIVIYEQLIEKFPNEVKTDNAMMAIAETYEIHLGELTKAQEWYERLFLEFSSSTLAVNARKKYRELRGDLF